MDIRGDGSNINWLDGIIDFDLPFGPPFCGGWYDLARPIAPERGESWRALITQIRLKCRSNLALRCRQRG
jgi:hypothetical protein